MSPTAAGNRRRWVSRIGPTPDAVSSLFDRGITMESKLTPELSQALDRAIDAAASDPLVEALGILRELIEDADIEGLISRAEEDASQQRDYAERTGDDEDKEAADRVIVLCTRAQRIADNARAVLAKYRPVSDSDTLKS